jgi:hypothetical protein
MAAGRIHFFGIAILDELDYLQRNFIVIQEQRCQIFLGTKDQNGEKYTK